MLHNRSQELYKIPASAQTINYTLSDSASVSS